ncbi:UDP-4-amino-4,6-dideoxy-N-acetyl-beta-L-altrosamine N-acetyltransferase [Paenibacillus vini]|uniref:UDP-4-amino-4, 6-dideoxy-N-acetyl-beta-L-altrosamine N-acetyltransferase n=1 Tax=Paenibacillus vini TaxID=1476024 RepID=UPI0025B7207C|nr:UDP-4-amino-4,6-dideoxy-N-acetyl-beta-L-altrosamine N-acetyltransferase [Paenibacillus vini]MDN4066452.1 UDP-4-amino-4,6-dideoxy-N-acetyl-beta-L-altrosamine N-acetyltransferase [Paenibacillus vini]
MLRFVRIKEHHLEMILRWRTQPEVTKYMYSDIEFDLKKQKEWHEKVKKDPNERYWIIEFNNQFIGLVSLNQIDWGAKCCSWAFYIGEPKARLFGTMIFPYVYRYIFEELQFSRLIGEVMEGNENIRKIHRIYGSREIEVIKNRIYKYGKYHDVYVMEMLDSDWFKIKEKYIQFKAYFEE